MNTSHPQLHHARPGSLWLLTCTVDDNGRTTTFTDVLARRLPDEIAEPGSALFELLPLGERVLVDADQILEATPATLHLDPPVPPRHRLRIIPS